MSKIVFQVSGYLTKIESKTNSWKIVFETSENISGEKIATFSNLKNKPSWMTVNSHVIEAEDIIDLPPLRPIDKDQKTKSQRLRASLYRAWESNNEGFKTSEQHYDYYMDKMINWVKDKIND